MKYIFQIILVASIFLMSCNNMSSDSPEDIIATFSGENLTLDQAKLAQPKGLSEEDSLSWVDEFKMQWLKSQIIIAKAEKDLPKSELDIDLDLMQYKADLLKYKYENYYLKKKINTQVSSSEIEAFYKENKNALITSKTLVKAIYIEVENSIKDKYKVKQWLISKKEKDLDKLKVYCFKNAKVFDDFNEDWLELNSLRLMSHSNQLKDNKMIQGRVIEQKNDSLTHYILINEMIVKGNIMPLEYAEEEIIKIIINKRKNSLLEEFSFKINQELEKQANKK